MGQLKNQEGDNHLIFNCKPLREDDDNISSLFCEEEDNSETFEVDFGISNARVQVEAIETELDKNCNFENPIKVSTLPEYSNNNINPRPEIPAIEDSDIYNITSKESPKEKPIEQPRIIELIKELLLEIGIFKYKI